MKPGILSRELKEALGMPDGAPPPWLINMQVIVIPMQPVFCLINPISVNLLTSYKFCSVMVPHPPILS